MRTALLIAYLLLSLPARADPTEAVPESKGGLLFPALQLSASTDDQGKFKATVPYLFPVERLTLIGSLRLQIASAKGGSTIFSSAGNETLPWEAGLSLLMIDPAAAENVNVRAAKIRAYDLCAQQCTDPKTCPFTSKDKNFKIAFDKKDLCPNGLAQFLAYEATLSGTRSLPEARLSIGAAFGMQQFKYLSGTFGPGQSLASVSATEHTTRGGVLYTRTFGLEQTHVGLLDIRGLYAGTWSAASNTGHWCMPEGMVGSDPNSSVQQCKDLALGGPTHVRSVTLAADVGVVDSFAQSWRASLGAFSTTGIANVPDSFGIEAPMYFNFTPGSTFVDYVGSYKGILRLTPRVSWARDASNHFPTTVVLTVEVLAQDSIFSEVLDY